MYNDKKVYTINTAKIYKRLIHLNFEKGLFKDFIKRQ